MYSDLSINTKFNGQRDQLNFIQRVIELGYGRRISHLVMKSLGVKGTEEQNEQEKAQAHSKKEKEKKKGGVANNL